MQEAFCEPVSTLKFLFLQSYADEGHLLEGVIEHVYRSMQNFFEECLTLDTDERAKEREEAKAKEEAK